MVCENLIHPVESVVEISVNFITKTEVPSLNKGQVQRKQTIDVHITARQGRPIYLPRAGLLVIQKSARKTSSTILA